MELRGIFPAVVTPLDPGGVFAVAAFERLIERLYGADVHGLYICGQTGEGLLQSTAQRKRVAEVAVAASPPGKSVIVHVGARATEEAIDLSRHAASIGAHAVSSLPPLEARSFAEIRRHYAALAAASDLPLCVYFFPELCPVLRSTDELLELAALPNVVGVKFTDFDLYRLSVVKDAGVTVWNGRDEVLAPGLLMGADGGIGTFYNLIPELFVEVYEHARAGRWEEARATQRRINELIRITLAFPLFPAIKRMLAWSGIDCGACLGPRRALDGDEESRLSDRLRASSFATLGRAPLGPGRHADPAAPLGRAVS